MGHFRFDVLGLSLGERYFRILALVLAVSVWIFGVGCSHTRHIRASHPEKEAGKIDRALGWKKAKIIFVGDAPPLTAKNVQVSADSIYYVNAETSDQERVAISDVHRIVTKDHALGAAEGFVFGALSWGGLIGLSFLAIGGEPEPVEDGPGEGILVYYAVMGGAPLPILGTLIGAGIGSRNVYVFNEKTSGSTDD